MRGLLGHRFALAVLAIALASGRADAQTLARIIARAPAGTVVVVSPGVHHGDFKLTRPILLVGTPGAVIDGDGRGDVIRISAPDVTVRNLTIRDSGTSLTDMNAGIYVEKRASRARIEDNRLSRVLFGIYLDGPSGASVIGNQVREVAGLRQEDRGDGIHMWEDTRALVKDNDIGGTRDGIYIYISPHNRIVGNAIHDVRYGVHYMYSNHNLLEGNRSYHNVAGFALMQSNHLRIIGNVSEEDEEYGLLLNYITFSELTGNLVRKVSGDTDYGNGAVRGTPGKGIFVYNSEDDRFKGNVIADCPIGIHMTAGSEDNVLYENSFIGNRVQVKYVQNVTEEWSWQGTGNYWSDYLGWDLRGRGVGDAPYRPNDGVDVLLWKYPQASLLMSSPAILVLRLVQQAFPVFTPPGIVDSHPLMKPPAADRGV